MRILPVLMLALSGCASVVLPTAARLSGIDPLTAEPSDFEVVARLSPGLDIAPGGAVFTLSATRGDGETLEESVVLAREGDAFRIGDADLPRVRAFQSRVLDWKATEAGARGSMRMDVTGCQSGPIAGDAAVSVDIRLTDGGPFLPLLRPVPLGAEVLAEMGPCP